MPEKLTFGVLLIMQVGPVWLVPYMVTQDGPSHIENASILRQYRDSPLYRQYFRINPDPIPNWFSYAVEGALAQVASTRITEKLFISAYVFFFTITARYAIQTRNPGIHGPAVLVFPLVFNCLAMYGLFNFCWSMILFLFTAEYWGKNTKVGRRQWCTMMALSCSVYFCHVFSLLVTRLFAAAVTFTRLRTRQWRLRDALIALSAFIPAVSLALWFVWTQRSVTLNSQTVSFGQRWAALWRASTIVFSYAPADVLVSSVFGVLLLILAVWTAVERRWNIWTFMAAVMILLYFISPPQSGIGQYVLERWNLYILLAITMWVASAAHGRLASTVMVIGGLAISTVLVTRLVIREREINVELAEYLSVADAVEPASTLLPIHFDSRGPGDLQLLYGMPMRHAASYIAADRSGLNLDNYEAQTLVFPLIFRDNMNPGVYIGHMEDEPPSPNFAGYGQRTGGRVDYVLVWDPMHRARGTPEFAAISGQLRAGYLLVRSSTHGSATLFRRLSHPR